MTIEEAKNKAAEQFGFLAFGILTPWAIAARRYRQHEITTEEFNKIVDRAIEIYKTNS